jgi:hypothetical protein
VQVLLVQEVLVELAVAVDYLLLQRQLEQVRQLV